MNLDKEWYTTAEVAEILEIQKQSINRDIRNNYITNVKQINKKNYIHRDAILEMFRDKEMLKEYYTAKEAAEKLGKTSAAMRNMIYRKTLKTAISYRGASYVKKDEIHSQMNCFCDTLRVHEVVDKYDLAGADVTYMAESGIVESTRMNKIWYLNVKSLEEAIEKIQSAFCLDKTSDITKTHLIAFQNGANGLKVEEASERLGLSTGVIRGYIRSGEVKAYQVGTFYYIPESEIEKFFNTIDGIKRRYFNSDDIHSFYSEIMEHIISSNEKCTETLKMLRLWSTNKLNSSKASIRNKKLMISGYINLAKAISELLEDNIWGCDENEFNKLMEEIDLDRTRNILNSFYAYVQTKKECKNTTLYSVKKIVDEDDAKSKDEKYTKSEWVMFKKYLTNYELHIDKAKNSKKYAQCWLYAILHLSLSWRSSDFLRIPVLSPSEILGDSIENIDLAKLTYAESQRIVNLFRNSSLPIIANKNGVKAHIVIVPELIRSTAIAFCVNEIHAKKEKSNTMFLYKRINTEFLDGFFPENFPRFENRKANKSKMTYSFEIAVNKKGRAELAYQLQSFARSHKVNSNGMANSVTAAYLSLTDTMVDSKSITKHLFERGVFGWQIELMLEIIEEGANDSLEERTLRIKKLSKEFSPIVVEGMSSYMNTVSKQASELTNELISMDVSKLKIKLESIAKIQSPGLLKNTQCIKEVSNCPYPEGENMCLGCKYNVPTNYVLEIVNVRLNEVLTLLENTPMSDIIMRAKYTHITRKLLFILMDFRRCSKSLGDDYLTSFIDLKSLSQRYSALEKSKFLILGDSTNGN